MPQTLDIEDIKIGRSEIKNKVIARFFKEIKFIEEWGTGIKRIIRSCNEAGLEEPIFMETGMFFKVIIKKNSGDKVAISSDKIEEGSERFICNVDKIQLSSAEGKIIYYLKEHESITNKKASEVTGSSSSGAGKYLKV